MKKKLLIIDDDEELCRELSEIFQSEGYGIRCVFNGDRIEETLEGQEFDIIIVDFKMPGISGIEALKMVLEKSGQSSIFLATGRPYIEDLLKKEGLGESLGGIFVKPFDPGSLLERIKFIGEKSPKKAESADLPGI